MASQALDDNKEIDCYDFVVIGGGIAGVTCAENLSTLGPTDKILLVSSSPLIKAVTNFRQITKTLEEFDIVEMPMFELGESYPNVVVIHDEIVLIDKYSKRVRTGKNKVIQYRKLCICSGGYPKLIDKHNEYILGIRDTETVRTFQEKLQNARRIVVLGNGGIATELVYEIENCEIIWAIKDDAITSTFIDAGASKFFTPVINKDKQEKTGSIKRTKYRIHNDEKDSLPEKHVPGCALGPDWQENLFMKGTQHGSHSVYIEYKVEVADFLSAQQLKDSGLKPDCLPYECEENKSQHLWPIYVKLNNSRIYGCDFVVSATGVVPNIPKLAHAEELVISEDDGGILVDKNMQTSIKDIYAAGDVCHINWNISPYWVQMRLWSQARQMGAYAAQCMTAHRQDQEIAPDFCFEMFAHVTKFFGYKVVLLGKFNAQGLDDDHELLVRVTEGKEYVKVVLKDNKMHGALLVGETDLEETFENLILNQMDLSAFKEDLLDPNIDIEDFFD